MVDALPGFQTPDPARDEVAQSIRDQDPEGTSIAGAFRRTFDQIYDGQRTGRYRLDQLAKTEKTHFGTLFEINLQRALKFDDGDVLDYNIEGHEVDCKYSHTAKWMLPPESFEQLVLVATADDAASTWSLGIVRVTEANRRSSQNRDQKTQLNPTGVADILWLYRDHPMPPNTLLSLPEEIVGEIFAQRSGQKRIDMLLRRATNLRITRNIIATVGRQEDYMKRVRSNGGARSTLRPEGIIVLSGDFTIQKTIAEQLGGAVPKPGEVVSQRVVPTESPNGVQIGDLGWRLANPDEEATVPAPHIEK